MDNKDVEVGIETTMADCYVRTDIMVALKEFSKTEGTTFEHFLGFLQQRLK